MTIPTPGEFVKRAQERKQQELDSAAKLAEAKKQHPAGKGSSSRPSKRTTSVKELTRSGTQTPKSNVKSSLPSPSSETSGTPATPKKPFVRKPHLTQRLSNNEELQKLRDSLPMNKTQGSRKTSPQRQKYSGTSKTGKPSSSSDRTGRPTKRSSTWRKTKSASSVPSAKPVSTEPTDTSSKES